MVTVRRCPYPARAWWADELIAESAHAVRVGENLWFPWADVRAAALRAAGVEAWGGGTTERFDAGVDHLGVVRRWVVLPPGMAAKKELAGYAVIDDRQARVEIADGDNVIRLPYWGDADDLIAVLSEGAIVHDQRRPVVEGSQMLGQAIVAAMRRTGGRRVASAHMLFLRVADANQPLSLELSPLSEGRTFTAFDAVVTQAARVCAKGTLLLDIPGRDVVRHVPELSDVGDPRAAVPFDMGVTGRELRVVDGTYTDDPAAPVGPPCIDAWVRFRSVPDEQALHAGLLAQFTGHMSIAAALRPHAGVGQREAHRTISTAINAIAISFHADVHMDQWVLYRHLATVVTDGQAHSECRAYDEARSLLASFSVDAMIRPLDRADVDPKTSL